TRKRPAAVRAQPEKFPNSQARRARAKILRRDRACARDFRQRSRLPARGLFRLREHSPHPVRHARLFLAERLPVRSAQVFAPKRSPAIRMARDQEALPARGSRLTVLLSLAAIRQPSEYRPLPLLPIPRHYARRPPQPRHELPIPRPPSG